jgi:SAM-dependent methyltransferase
MPCRICNAATVDTFTLGSTKLLFCSSCDIVYIALMPSMEDLKTHYEKEYTIYEKEYTIEAHVPDLAAAEHRRIFRLPEQIKLIADIIALKPAPATVLDIGCDRAFFIDEIRRFGYEVKGVEPSIVARGYCKRIGIDAVPTLDDITEKFDIIVLWHSLEHFSNPTALMQSIRCRLTDDGLILVRVPAFDSVWRRLLGRKWVWYQPKSHYFHYSVKSLRKLFELAGFNVIRIKKQRPNDRLTRKSYEVAERISRHYLNYIPTLRKTLNRFYEDITGVELYAIGKKQKANLS